MSMVCASPTSLFAPTSLSSSHPNAIITLSFTHNTTITTRTKHPQTMHHQPKRRPILVCCSMGGKEVYQPFRPPSQDPALGSLSVQERLEILMERRGLWHEYAAHIPALIKQGIAPFSIEENSALSGVEQNQIVVASQVRLSLLASGLDREVVDFFDVGGAGVLYELRILSNEQRKSAAELGAQRNMDVKEAREITRAMKEYSRRRNEEGWGAFSSSPGDCMAFACYRASKEHGSNAKERESLLRQGLSFVESKAGQVKIMKALGEQVEEKEEEVDEIKTKDVTRLSVVDLNLGEAAGLVMLAVAAPSSTSIEAAPSRGALGKGPYRIYSSETLWKAWVPIPAWESVVTAAAPIAVLFADSKILPTKPSRVQDPVLVLVDKRRLDVEENCFYLVKEGSDEDVLSIQLGSLATQNSRKLLAKVLIAVKPPSLTQDDDWD